MRHFPFLAYLLISLTGIAQDSVLSRVPPAKLGFNAGRLGQIDSICKEAIDRGATPGCVVLVARNGKIVYEKAFGYQTYDRVEPVNEGTIYDLASCTKICATTMAVMKLYDDGRLDLQRTLGDYLPWVRGSDKASLRIWDVLLHQAGLKAFIPFYKETIDSSKEGLPLPAIYSTQPDSLHTIRVADSLYIRTDWEDTLISTHPAKLPGAEG